MKVKCFLVVLLSTIMGTAHAGWAYCYVVDSDKLYVSRLFEHPGGFIGSPKDRFMKFVKVEYDAGYSAWVGCDGLSTKERAEQHQLNRMLSAKNKRNEVTRVSGWSG